MKDILQDIIDHTLPLGDVELLKITGTTTTTTVSGKSGNTVFLNCNFKNPVADFIGTFGLPNLPKLKTILGFSDEYDDNAVITVLRETIDNVQHPVTIHFENKTGDFVNDYRLMAKGIVEDRIKSVQVKVSKWDIDFEPTIAGVSRLKKQGNLHSEEELFKTTLKSGNLSVQLGNPANYTGNFVFHQGITGTLNKTLGWPIKQFIAIMDLLGDKRIYITDQGAMRITIDSGIAEYEYLLPAQSK